MYFKDIKQIIEDRVGKGKLQWKKFPDLGPTTPLKWLVSYQDRPLFSMEHNGPRCSPQINYIDGRDAEEHDIWLYTNPLENSDMTRLRKLYPDWIIFAMECSESGDIVIIGTQTLWFGIRYDYIFQIDEPAWSCNLNEYSYENGDIKHIDVPEKWEDLEMELSKWILTGG